MHIWWFQSGADPSKKSIEGRREIIKAQIAEAEPEESEEDWFQKGEDKIREMAQRMRAEGKEPKEDIQKKGEEKIKEIAQRMRAEKAKENGEKKDEEKPWLYKMKLNFPENLGQAQSEAPNEEDKKDEKVAQRSKTPPAITDITEQFGDFIVNIEEEEEGGEIGEKRGMQAENTSLEKRIILDKPFNSASDENMKDSIRLGIENDGSFFLSIDEQDDEIETGNVQSGWNKIKEAFTVNVSDKEIEGEDIPVVFEGPESVKPSSNLGKSAQSNFSVPTVVFDQNKKSSNVEDKIQPEKDLSVEFGDRNKATGKSKSSHLYSIQGITFPECLDLTKDFFTLHQDCLCQ